MAVKGDGRLLLFKRRRGTGYRCSAKTRDESWTLNTTIWVPPSSVFQGLSLELKGFSVAFLEYLVVKGCKPSTLECYLRSVKLLGSYLQGALDQRSVREVSVEDLRSFTINLLDRFAETTVYGHVVGVRQFFEFLEVSGAIRESPARTLAPPSLKPQPVRILGERDLRALLRACSGDGFLGRRDMALFRVFMATGARPDEVLGLRIGPRGSDGGSLNLSEATVTFQSEVGHLHRCALDPRTVNYLKRYIRLRSGHRNGRLPDLWLTRWGGLTRGGLNGIVRSRREKAGLKDFKLHKIRATFAHQWIANGGNSGDLMRTLGLQNRRSIKRFSEGVTAAITSENARALYATRRT